MSMDILLFEKGAARVAVDSGDETTKAQLRADGWTEFSQQTTTRPEPFQEAVNQAAMAAPPAAPAWHPDLPGNIVGHLAQRYGTPDKAAAAADADLWAIGGMTPQTISLIRSGA